MARRPPLPASLTPRPPLPTQDLRERILADFTVLRIPLTAAHLDAALAQAAQDGCSHLEFLHRLITDQAGLRRERSTARREEKGSGVFSLDHSQRADRLKPI